MSGRVQGAPLLLLLGPFSARLSVMYFVLPTPQAASVRLERPQLRCPRGALPTGGHSFHFCSDAVRRAS